MQVELPDWLPRPTTIEMRRIPAVDTAVFRRRVRRAARTNNPMVDLMISRCQLTPEAFNSEGTSSRYPDAEMRVSKKVPGGVQ